MTPSEENWVTLDTWDARNRLTGLSGPGVSASFGYDGLARRWTKTVNAARTDFLYDGQNPVQEGVLPGTPAANLLTGLGIDEYLTRTDVAGARTLLTDALGSTLALTDSIGTVTTEYTYEPFGDTTATGASNTNAFQYTGRENDGTGLYSYRARYYLPGLGRFIAEDPIGFEGDDVNLYAYVYDSPMTYIDPLGLFVAPGRIIIRPGPIRLPPNMGPRPPLPRPKPKPSPIPREDPGRPQPRGPEGFDPHPHGGHPHPWEPFQPCVDVPCIGPAGVPGTILPPSGPPPTSGRKDPQPAPPLPPPCPPLDQLMGLCAPPQT